MRLSICITTLNRAAYIGETLESILPQLTPDVELIVVDANSSDGTEEIVQSFVQRSSSIRFLRLPKNNGLDQDYCLAVAEARGEFCWLMSDDDLIVPGAVEKVLGELKSDLDLLIVNAEVRSKDMQTILEVKKLKILKDRTYPAHNFEAFFIDTASYLSFIGAVVIRRSVWMERDRESYFNTMFIHMGVIFQRVITGAIKVLADPLVRIRYGNAQWSSRSFQIWMFKWPDLLWSFTCLSDRAKANISPRYPWMSLQKLALMRALGCYSKSEYKKFLSIIPLKFRILSLGVAIFPGRLLNLMAQGYYSWIRPDEVTLTDLRSCKLNPFFKPN
jgi:abequosyltransferase